MIGDVTFERQIGLIKAIVAYLLNGWNVVSARSNSIFGCLPNCCVKNFQLDEPDSSNDEYYFIWMDCSHFKNDSDEFD